MAEGSEKSSSSEEWPPSDSAKSPKKACPDGSSGQAAAKRAPSSSSKDSSGGHPPDSVAKNARTQPRAPPAHTTTSTTQTTQHWPAHTPRPSPHGASIQSAEARKEKALQDEATRLFVEMASDPEIMDQALSAAVNPKVARELARQADTAWRNIETLPGGFRALCQMHHTLQQPLWNAVVGQDIPKVSKYQGAEVAPPVPNEPIRAVPLPNPWRVEPPRRLAPSGGLGFPVDDFNPFSFSNFNDSLPGHAPTSRRPRDEMLSSVISRTHSSSFQTASQLIQNSSVLYSKELDEMAEMGLTDRDKCLTALEAADGDLFQALGILQNLEELDKEESNNK